MNKNQIKEDKLKPLIPTLREKKRFVKINIESNKKLDFNIISKLLTEEITFYMGAIDFGKAGIWFLRDKFDFEKQELIIRTNIKYKDKLLTSLQLIRKLQDANINIKTLRVSGTIKGVLKEK